MRHYDLPGHSLAATLTEGKPTGRKVAISENMVQITAVGERYKLGLWIKRFEPNYPDMLFDREKDPLELNNLIGPARSGRDGRRAASRDRRLDSADPERHGHAAPAGHIMGNVGSNDGHNRKG